MQLGGIFMFLSYIVPMALGMINTVEINLIDRVDALTGAKLVIYL